MIWCSHNPPSPIFKPINMHALHLSSNQMKPFTFVFWFIVTCFNLLCYPSKTITHASFPANETDRLALLKFKESISDDPSGVLDSWNTSTHFCNWIGVTCDSMDHERVTELNLTGYKLHGYISPQLGNLSFLTLLNLQNNYLYGKIPPELGCLSQMESLILATNSLSGQIPSNLTACAQLTSLDLSRNNLVGNIPSEIGSLSKLRELHILINNLTGRIPPSIGNLSSLTDLDLYSNNLEGNVPKELGRLKNLTSLDLSANKLSGMLPSFLYDNNMSYIRDFSIVDNQFKGSLPPNLFNNLPFLQFFAISGNDFSSTIPISVTNASLLGGFDISDNHFVGHVPSLARLNQLSFLNLYGNNLGGNTTEDLDFLKTLTNCTYLELLDIGINSFGGQLSNYLGNLSSKLNQLYLDDNHIYGKIPFELANLVSLYNLRMENNHFDGIIPTTFGKLKNMGHLNLRNNSLSGHMPNLIGNLSKLYYLDLSNNLLEGNIPTSIKKCLNLQYLSFFENNLGGAIPLEVFSLVSVTLDLSHNFFDGNLPDEVGNLKNINKLDLSENNLSGDIPENMKNCLSLEYLYLQGNYFNGVIPSSLVSLRGLIEVDLSRNRLSGSIPEGLQDFMFLEFLNVSFNMLEGEVPTKGVFGNASKLALTGNEKLCGGISQLHLPPCYIPAKHHHLRLIVAIVSVVASILLFSITLAIYFKKKGNKKSSFDSPIIDQMEKVSYQSLYRGTDGFSVRNLIGSGTFGSVYKGTIEPGDEFVAIKVFNLQKKAAEKSFLAECNALKNVRHRNLVKVLTCCSSTDYGGQEFKALVFELMANGSLESWLHPEEEAPDRRRSLDLEQMLNIIVDVASAFHYLHYECEQTIVHCDLKPSNVLLDDCMVAHVGDFGLARLLSSIGMSRTQTSTFGIKGTIGYAPPEYGTGSEASIEGDMYSFGILLLEMLTRKRPTDEMFRDDHDLHTYVKTSIPDHLLYIVDKSIIHQDLEQAAGNEIRDRVHPKVKQCLLLLFRIALSCSVKSPKERMNMIDVMTELILIKNSFPSRRSYGV